MSKKLFLSYLIICGVLFFNICFSLAQETESASESFKEEIFKAKVLEVLEQEEFIGEDNSKYISQKLKVEGLEGRWEDIEVIVSGIEINPSFNELYQKGDKVLVSFSEQAEGESDYYIVDFVRLDKIYWLAAIFCLVILLTGRWRGLRAIMGLGFSFLIIFKFVIPKILDGSDPLSVSLLFSAIIILVSTYLVYGLNKKSSVAILGTFAGITIVGILSLIFTELVRLAGFAQEETIFLVNLMGSSLNLKGLLLAGFIIGALGVLDDITISQVSAVEELTKANPGLSKFEIYKRAMKIGIDHVASMVNTLFLAYAGASFPLLLLFVFKQPPFETLNRVINNEVIATEIVRALVGSIGLALAVPITTFLAAYIYKRTAEKINVNKN
ncbi:MAG: hypothetical protein A2Y98_02285 [Candidatus Portnoybacteria bacterium RBG_19FT_COMBO_36_7]|uniref:YibE/F family protein n=1 Tax=Candidatus Portnoybacteria bacterium RBG_19FT_COMBO_36_7 TaxID=1801992 RepID=A0A1G2F941_9BACT|nr:MAG: hypothetical protein A2Y98_02285 [Candidatus Portnoybacteria bacterium RBG_19FT_COMBO_36_7]